MIHTKLFLFIASLFVINSIYSQTPHTLLVIGDQNYSVEEFDFIYNKNNSYSQEPKSKKDYIDLFVNYKLKVLEAIDQGFDTLPSFKKEFNYYKEELAKPYLSDKSVTENLKKEAYNRLTNEVNASHILIRLPKSPTPDDTLKAYNKIKSIIEKYNNGEDFNDLAQQYSEDPSAKANKGKLGYFSGFMMVYPFESAAYNTPVGEISDIIRTSFGYHVIKVHDKRPGRGEIRTAHIMQMFPPNSSKDVVNAKREKIDSIYQLIQNGEDFGTLAQNFSEDRNSARNNGELPWFGSGRMIPEYSEPAFQLDSIGEISKVIQTPYGFHIIKLLEKRGVKPYEEMLEEITNRISKDERAFQGKKAVINRLKKEYNYKENNNLLASIKKKAAETKNADKEFYVAFDGNKETIASFSDVQLTVEDLLTNLKSNRQFSKANKANMFNKLTTDFIESKIIEFEKSRLIDKYDEYKFLLNEYHDGLLIFEISQKEIWNKATGDSAGIRNYYESHKADYYYPEKITGRAIFVKDKKTYKMVKNLLNADSEISNDSLKVIFDKNSIKCIDGEFEKGQFAAIDKQVWNDKKSSGKIDEEFPFVYTMGKTESKKPKEFEETKGQVISDYQSKIEKEWIQKLKEKYSPMVNKKALKFSKK